MAKLLFISGSVRRDSFNKKLTIAAYEAAKEAGVDAKLIDLLEYEMPIYDGDVEAARGIPVGAKELKQEFIAADGFFIASPEYNSSMSPILLNALHWISRKDDGTGGELVAFTGKVAALASASPGWRGGLRGLVPLKMMLGNIGVHVLPDEVNVTAANKAFDDKGSFTEARYTKSVKDLVTKLNNVAGKLK